MSRRLRWIDPASFAMLHAETLVDHGGRDGVRDVGLLDSALARPRQLLAYEPEIDLARLAAGYALGLARNHPFIDGNKRAAFLAIGLFLALNGHVFTPDKLDAVRTMQALADGQLTDDDLADWIRGNMSRRRRSTGAKR